MTLKKIIFPNVISDKNLLYKDIELKFYHLIYNEINRKVLMIDLQKNNRQKVEKIFNLIKGNLIYQGYLKDLDYKMLSESVDTNIENLTENCLYEKSINLKEVISSIDEGNNVSKIWFSKYLLSNEEEDKTINIYNSYISLENVEQMCKDDFIKEIELRYKDIQKFKNKETDRFFVKPLNDELFNKMENFIKEIIENNN